MANIPRKAKRGLLISDTTDPTKVVQVSAENVTTGTTRVLKTPNRDGVLPDVQQLIDSGESGAMFHFPSGSYFEFIDSADYNWPTDFSIHCRVYFEDLSGINVLYSKWRISPFGGILFYTFAGTSKLTLYVADEAGSGSLNSGNTTLVTGKWYDLWAVRSGTTTKLYVDGVLDLQVTVFAYNPVLASPPASVIGAYPDYTYPFKGCMNYMQLFNYGVSEADIIRYSVLCGIRFADANATNTAITSGTLTIGKRYRTLIHSAGNFTNVADTGAAANVAGAEWICIGTTPTSWGGDTLTRIGCVLDLNPNGIVQQEFGAYWKHYRAGGTPTVFSTNGISAVNNYRHNYINAHDGPNAYYLPTDRGTNYYSLSTDGAGATVWDSKALTTLGDIKHTSFNIAAVGGTPTTVTGLIFSGTNNRAFWAIVSVFLDTTVDLVETFELQGIYRTSDTTWRINVTSSGDATGVDFDITSAGQVTYTNTSGLTGTMRFRASALPI